ncbi:uncharacterized protein BDR25DRAFT_3494 [Lindgomyces ingoldianus]|uniref:Uncharacterized protein n=1 Tax=Lindgomyces ingoldianus TaxID=673940 RepID=A0ACB6RG89_9PLEO|nr:uncharacterized protein BDR25DRAFT_3494 [Lindgomyces ingoldianus]KAF2477745.1 hypothetical protein BDR25DRAFT_3494 [Lindgomyces ingoldianus]
MGNTSSQMEPKSVTSSQSPCSSPLPDPFTSITSENAPMTQRVPSLPAKDMSPIAKEALGGKKRWVRKSGVGEDEQMGAEKALQDTRDLGSPPDLRSRGEYTSDEQELLRRAITAYMKRFQLDTEELVATLEYTIPTKYSEERDDDHDEERRKKAHIRAFWKEMHDILPARTSTSVQRFVRRRYNGYKNAAGRWTQKEDDLLKSFEESFPKQWTKISKLLGTRSAGDCYDRWRNYIQYGENLKTSRWTQDEEEMLRQAVSDVVDLLTYEHASEGKTLRGYDVMNDINWHTVSQKMGATRSRLQCLSKWKQLQTKEGAGLIFPKHQPKEKSGKKIKKKQEGSAEGKTEIDEVQSLANGKKRKAGKDLRASGKAKKAKREEGKSNEFISASDDE